VLRCNITTPVGCASGGVDRKRKRESESQRLMEDIRYNITGLSSSKVTHHLLQNKIQSLITKIWKLHLEMNQSSPPMGDHQTTLTNSLNELFPFLQTISWNHSNTQQALRSLPLLLIDLLKISFLYFSCSSAELLSSYSPQIIEQIVSQSIQLLEEVRLEKHCDLLIDDLPVYLLIIERSLSNFEVSSKLSSLLIPLMNLLQIHAVTYTNRKKLFLSGSTILLKPFLSFSAHLLFSLKQQPSSSSPSSSWRELSLKSVDDVLTKIFFDEIHHIEELTQIPLTTFILSGNEKGKVNETQSDINATPSEEQKKKRKRDGNGDDENTAAEEDKKQKLTSGKSSKALIHTYHMSFYSSIAEWVYSQSSEVREGDKSCGEEALGRLVHLYFKSSKDIAQLSSSDRTLSFVQKWRLHMKRVLHLGLGLIYSICGDGLCSEISLLKFRNAIFDCLNQTEGRASTNSTETLTSSRQIGAIPDHESLNIYVQRLRELGDSYLTRSLALSKQLREVTDTDSDLNCLNTLTVDVTFLRTSIALDCRMVTDTSLSLT
jgi:hypothetical protein